VRGLVRFVALAKFLTGGQDLSPKTHQHFIPGLVGHNAKKNDNMKTIILSIYLGIFLSLNLFCQTDSLKGTDSISTEAFLDLLLGKINGKLKIELADSGQLTNDKKDGIWNEYYYKPCLSCNVYSFNYDSVLHFESLYHDLTFYKNSGEYLNGMKIGTWTNYKTYKRAVPFGWEKFMSVNYVNNLKKGWEIEFHNDTLIKKSYYKDGLKDSIEYYYESGNKLLGSTSFKKGLKKGVCYDYYDNGKIETERNYINGLQVGTLKYYNTNGVLQFEILFDKGEPGDTKIYVDSLDISEKGMALLFFPPHNKHIRFHKNGHIKSIDEFVDGPDHQIIKDFYPNGNIMQEFELKNDTIDGIYKYYYENSNLWTERLYIKGKVWEVLT
jgi:antitoxin component YwqK of YwqJK toxin-antitoxin module